MCIGTHVNSLSVYHEVTGFPLQILFRVLYSVWTTQNILPPIINTRHSLFAVSVYECFCAIQRQPGTSIIVDMESQFRVGSVGKITCRPESLCDRFSMAVLLICSPISILRHGSLAERVTDEAMTSK